MNVYLQLLSPTQQVKPARSQRIDRPEILEIAGTWVYAKEIAKAINRPVSYASATLQQLVKYDLLEVRKVKVAWSRPLVNQYRRR